MTIIATTRMIRCWVLAIGTMALAVQVAAGAGPANPAGGGSSALAGDGHQPDAGMLRFPDISATHIVFVYANDLWLVPREGGLAIPLASPPGAEAFPRFSPDGRTIAFVGNYDGNRDIYTIPTGGGVPTRITHHPAGEILCGWTPGGRILFSSNGQAHMGRVSQLFTVSDRGGLPQKLPVPYGYFGAVSGDGRTLAYTPDTRDFATWKRYQGGLASDIWLFDLVDHTSRQITDWPGTDSQPMWRGAYLYYLADAGPAHKLNIWRWHRETGQREQVTFFDEYDVKWPAVGPGPKGEGEIVLQNGPRLYVVDLADRSVRPVSVTVPGDRPRLKPRRVNAADLITAADVSPSGKRAVLAARGDVWTVPAHEGPARNLTRTDDVAERDPAWSPDGKWIAYLSDATGEYELYLTRGDGRGETRQLTDDGKIFRYGPSWSPDSKHLAFYDASGTLYLHSIEPAATKKIFADPFGQPRNVSWAPDSRRLAYVKGNDARLSAIWLYELETDQSHQLTSGRFSDSWPTFDRKGDFLYFASHRSIGRPTYADLDGTFIYADTDVLMAVPLRNDVASPWLVLSDEESWEDEEADEDDDEKEEEADEEEDEEGEKDESGDEDQPADDDSADEPTSQPAADEEGAEEKPADEKPDEKPEKEKDEPKPVEIDLEGFESRALLMPLERGSFSSLAVNHEGHLLYTRHARRGSGGKTAVKIFDPSARKTGEKQKKEKTVLNDVGWFILTADGKKLLTGRGRTLVIVKAAADQKLDKPIPIGELGTTIDPQDEWRQMFHEAWRLQRDYFYDPGMHGVDWPAVRERYARLIEHCTSRGDVSFVIGEMISELNVGHAYLWGQGDVEGQPHTAVGLLGVDFELVDGAYRIARIYEGAPWDVDARNPLHEPGVEAKVGDYLLAVNATPVDAGLDPWAAFVGLAGQTVTLTLSDKPQLDDDARHVIIKTLTSEAGLRYRAWVEHNRAYVAEQSDGRIGYIHVPDTGVNGQNELFRQFYGQIDRAALIIDDRWNGGGQIPDRFIELLNRPPLSYWTRRHSKIGTTPTTAHNGPKCMLINGSAGSGGDCFPYYFRKVGLGQLIGRRTWGGLVGISGNPGLIDGGSITIPRFAFFETDGTWGVEGHGVEPDLEVIDDPALMVDGGDPQLDAAIEHLLQELKRAPYTPPVQPEFPDRSGIGITPEDR